MKLIYHVKSEVMHFVPGPVSNLSYHQVFIELYNNNSQ